MDHDPASQRERTARLRCACLVFGALLAAVLSLAAGPALAAATGRRQSGPLRRARATVRRHPRQRWRPLHRNRQVLGQAITVGVPAVTTQPLTVTGTAPRSDVPRARCHDAHARIGTVNHAGIQRAVVCLVNQQRRQRGLPTLRLNQRLDLSAQSWTNTMVRDRAFSHGTDFAARITAVGFDWSQIGENIADGYRTPASVVRAWMGSTGHCQNILNPDYREVGTGVDVASASGQDVRGTWTQDFGLLMGQRGADDWGPAEGCPY